MSQVKLSAWLKPRAEAKTILAKAEIEVTEIQRRSVKPFLKEEERKQKNIENITQKALPQLQEDAQPDKIEEDWIANFFDKSHLISDNKMQELWSRVLAGEANLPGSYSKRTINLLASLDKSDADLFTRLCGFGWHIGNVVPLVYDEQNEIYNKHNINFNSLAHLESIGLVQFQSFGYRRLKLPKALQVFYYGKSVLLEFPNDADNILDIGKAMLTQVGQELAPICGSHPIPEFFEYVCKKWTDQGHIKKEEPLPDTRPPVKSE